MPDFKQHQISATASNPNKNTKLNAQANSSVKDPLEWSKGKLAYCRILFTDVQIEKAVYLRVSANSDSRTARSEVFGRSDSVDFIEINHFEAEFDKSDPDYITGFITSRSSDEIEVVLQFIFVDAEGPTEKRYPLKLKQDVDEILIIPVEIS